MYLTIGKNIKFIYKYISIIVHKSMKHFKQWQFNVYKFRFKIACNTYKYLYIHKYTYFLELGCLQDINIDICLPMFVYV